METVVSPIGQRVGNPDVIPARYGRRACKRP